MRWGTLRWKSFAKVSFCFSWVGEWGVWIRSKNRDQKKKKLGRRRGKTLRGKQLLKQSNTGEGDTLTSCMCCHGYQSPVWHPFLAPHRHPRHIAVGEAKEMMEDGWNECGRNKTARWRWGRRFGLEGGDFAAVNFTHEQVGGDGQVMGSECILESEEGDNQDWTAEYRGNELR